MPHFWDKPCWMVSILTLAAASSQDVSIYKQNFEQKPSFNFDSMNMKDII